MELDLDYIDKLKSPLEGELSLRPSEYVQCLEDSGIEVANDRHIINDKFETHFKYLIRECIIENEEGTTGLKDFGFIVGADGWTTLSDEKRILLSTNHEQPGHFNLKMSEVYASKNPDKVTELSKHHLLYSFMGLLVSVICILGGIFLFISGISGSTSWSAKMFGAESDITDAAPGTILFVVGLFFAIVTRYKFTISSKKV